MENKSNIVVLGATGHFGQRISRRLVGEPGTHLIVTSRSAKRAAALSDELSQQARNETVRSASVDQDADDLESQLSRLSPDLVIHTAGPYQGQHYRVAEACIACGSHYIDLADGRRFVEDFDILNDRALEKDVLLITGASTLPGLSSVVVEALGSRFDEMTSVEISIAPAHRTPRGLGTVAAVLSYCGKAFEVLVDGDWVRRYGWQDLRRFRYPDLGSRIGAACDVPDLGLLPDKIESVRTVTFHAALEATWEQYALWLMAATTRIGLVTDWSRFASSMQRAARHFVEFGSDRGGMHIRIQGVDTQGIVGDATWYLTAERNHGPEIPCTPALILARKLASNELPIRGAMPCWNLFTLDDFDREVSALDISWSIEESRHL